MASRVFLTDKSKRILASATRSIAENDPFAAKCVAQRLTFGDAQECKKIVDSIPFPAKIDLIIASDVLCVRRTLEEPCAYFSSFPQLCSIGYRCVLGDSLPALRRWRQISSICSGGVS